MPDVFVARQPILNPETGGHRLRAAVPGGAADRAPVTDAGAGNGTGSCVNSMTEIGLEELVGDRPAWVNVTRDFLLGGMTHALPPERVVLEIVEDQLVDDQLVARVAELRQQGYRFALDDFNVETVQRRPAGPDRRGQARRAGAGARRPARHDRPASSLRPHARGGEGGDAGGLRLRRAVGLRAFQGYFFCRPELVRGRRIDADRLRLLEVLAALQDATVDLPRWRPSSFATSGSATACCGTSTRRSSACASRCARSGRRSRSSAWRVCGGGRR